MKYINLIPKIIILSTLTTTNYTQFLTPAKAESQNPVIIPTENNNQGDITNKNPHQKIEFHLIANPETQSNFANLREGLSKMPPDTALAIPLGSNSPIITRETISITTKDFEAIGFIDNQGKLKNITPKIVLEMVNNSKFIGGNISDVNGNLDKNNTSNHANSSYSIPRRLPSFNLIVRNRKTGKRFIIRRFQSNIFVRDVLNSFFNGNIRRY